MYKKVLKLLFSTKKIGNGVINLNLALVLGGKSSVLVLNDQKQTTKFNALDSLNDYNNNLNH